jgi:sugar phosphate isomerase/epimerase
VVCIDAPGLHGSNPSNYGIILPDPVNLRQVINSSPANCGANERANMPLIKSLSFRGLGLEFPGLSQAANLARQTGFQALDLPLRDLFEQKVNPTDINSIFVDNGLQAGACPFPFDWRSSKSHFQKTLELLPEFLDFLAKTGVRRLYTRVSESLADGQSAEDTVKWHFDRLSRIAQILSTDNIRLGLETVGVESFRQGNPPLMPTLSLIKLHLAYLFQIYPNTGLLVDSFHLHASGEKIEPALHGFENRVIGVHIADLPIKTDRKQIIDHIRALPGTTEAVPVRQHLLELQARGIDAPVMVETVCRDFAGTETDYAKIVALAANSCSKVFPDFA